MTRPLDENPHAHVSADGDATGQPRKMLLLDGLSDTLREAASRLGPEGATLLEMSESLSITLDSIGDGVIAMDRRGLILRMNPVAERLTAWTLAEARGRRLHEVLHLIDEITRADVEDPFTHVIREGAAVSLPPGTLLRRRDGTEIPLGDTCAPIPSNGPEPLGAVLVFRDLSPVRAAAQARALLQKQLFFAERLASIGTLAAGVAHEMNNPLCFVIANLDAALEAVRALTAAVPANAELAELAAMLRDAREGTGRVTKIVRGLTTLAHDGRQTLVPVELRPLLEHAVNISFHEIRHRARLVKDAGPLPSVMGDAGQLEQVFVNLLVNAAQSFAGARAEQNEIRVVTATSADGSAVVEVRDTGPGISPELQARIFDPFFTTKPVGLGTGLGLAISHRIVTSMGGTLTVESKVGKGSVFRVTLPATSPRAPPPPARTPQPGLPSLARKASVLVVDDEPSIGFAIRRVLRGHTVTYVDNGPAALELIAKGQPFDIVLLDMLMPGMSGIELHRQLCLLKPTMASRVVFMTGGGFNREASAVLEQDKITSLLKPFDSQVLKALVEKSIAASAEPAHAD